MYIKLCLTLSVSLLATDTWCIYCMYHCDNGSFIISVMMISSRTTLQIFHWNVHITMYINSTYTMQCYLQTRESWSGDHRYPCIPNFEWGNERNETCCDLSYNLIHFMAIKNLQILVIDNVVNFLLLAKLI
jgi:hypothetical protein